MDVESSQISPSPGSWKRGTTPSPSAKTVSFRNRKSITVDDAVSAVMRNHNIKERQLNWFERQINHLTKKWVPIKINSTPGEKVRYCWASVKDLKEKNLIDNDKVNELFVLYKNNKDTRNQFAKELVMKDISHSRNQKIIKKLNTSEDSEVRKLWESVVSELKNKYPSKKVPSYEKVRHPKVITEFAQKLTRQIEIKDMNNFIELMKAMERDNINPKTVFHKAYSNYQKDPNQAPFILNFLKLLDQHYEALRPILDTPDKLYRFVETCITAEYTLSQGAKDITERMEYYKKKNTGLPFSFVVDYTSKEYTILLKKESRLQAQGVDKKVRHAVNIQKLGQEQKESKLTLFVQAITRNDVKQIPKTELDYYKEFKGQRGIVQIHSTFNYLSTKKGQVRRFYFQVAHGSDFEHFNVRENKENRLSNKNLMAACEDIGYGLQAIHNKGFVHRDIKLGNLLISETKDGVKACICDLGSMLPKGATRNEFTFFYATELNTPPEMLKMEADICDQYRQASDMYALGIALHQLHIGELPWIEKWKEMLVGKVDYDLLKDEQEKIRDKLSEIAERKDANFESAFMYIIYKLLDPNPATRMTADQYLLAIKNLKQQFPQE